MTATTAFANTVNRLVDALSYGISVDPQVRINKAVDKAHSRITRRYAANDSAIFDKAFLHGNGAPIIAAYLDGAQPRHLAAEALSRAWNVDLGLLSMRDRRWRVAGTTMIADSFLIELSMILYA